MKNKQLFGTQRRRLYKSLCAVILMAGWFTLAGCPTSGEDESKNSPTPQTVEPQEVTYVSTDSDNTRYTLTITENANGNRAAYAPKSGDTFVLKVELFNDGNYSVSLRICR